MSGSSERFTLRVPDAGDVERLAHIHVQCWEQTYGAQLPPEFFGERAVEFRRTLWNRMVYDPAPGSRTVVAERGGEVIGFASAGNPISPEDPPPAGTELHMIYLLAEHHGSGAGQAMLDAVVGDRPAFLWVATENPRAQAFYRRNGFALDGLEKPDERVPSFRESRMVCPDLTR